MGTKDVIKETLSVKNVTETAAGIGMKAAMGPASIAPAVVGAFVGAKESKVAGERVDRATERFGEDNVNKLGGLHYESGGDIGTNDTAKTIGNKVRGLTGFGERTPHARAASFMENLVDNGTTRQEVEGYLKTSDKYIEANATRVNGQIAEDRDGNRKTPFLDFKENHDINASGNGREFNQFLDEAAKAKKQNPNAVNGPLVTTGDFNEFVRNRENAAAELGQPGKEAMTKKAHASVAAGQPLEDFNDATDSKKDRAKALQPDPQQSAKPQTKGGKKTADNAPSETPAGPQTAVASTDTPAPISPEAADRARAQMASLQSGGTSLTQDSSVVGQANAPAARGPQQSQAPQLA